MASIAAKHPSKNFMNPAARMRRSRQLQRAGAYHVNFVLAADARMRLVEAGWLGRADRDDKAAITAAVIECLAQTLGLQNGENEMPIKKAVPGHAQASPARETGFGLPTARNSKEAIPRAPQGLDKATALAAYRELLRGAELPAELVAVATAADLEVARARVVDFIAAASTEGGLGRWAERDRYRIISRWQSGQSSPQVLANEYGRPFLARTIAERQGTEAAAAQAVRRSAGLTIALSLVDSTIGELRARNFLAADANCAAGTALSAAVLRAIEFALDLPADRRLVDDRPHFAGPLARRSLAKAKQAAAAAQRPGETTISLHLPADVVWKLVDRFAPMAEAMVRGAVYQVASMADPEDEAMVRGAVYRAIALALNPPPPPPPPPMTPAEIYRAATAMDAFQRRGRIR